MRFTYSCYYIMQTTPAATTLSLSHLLYTPDLLKDYSLFKPFRQGRAQVAGTLWQLLEKVIPLLPPIDRAHMQTDAHCYWTW